MVLVALRVWSIFFVLESALARMCPVLYTLTGILVSQVKTCFCLNSSIDAGRSGKPLNQDSSSLIRSDILGDGSTAVL